MNDQSSTLFGFKVDIDTYEGGLTGIPNLVDLFKKHHIPASFFGVMGPDHSGRAAFRVFTHKGFLKKMLRTKAPKIYGIRTLLYGTLLPGPMMCEKLGDAYRMILQEGFELGMHGYDHIAWHNRLTGWTEEKIQPEYEKMISAYRKMAGRAPESLGTPGWQESLNHIRVTDRLGIAYRSDMRFSQPFFPVGEGYASRVLEIPTTFPSLDEILGNSDQTSESSLVTAMMKSLQRGKVNVFTLHTELEGRSYLPFLEEFILELKKVDGLEFLNLRSIAERALKNGPVVQKAFSMGEVSGRAGLVAVAGEKVNNENH